jgi:hypothetical protein
MLADHSQRRILHPGSGWIFLILIICLSSCSSSYVVTPTGRNGEFSFENLNGAMRGKEATILLKDGREIDGSDVRIERDSVFFAESVYKTNPKTLGRIRTDGNSGSIPIHSVQRIIWEGRLIGALEGLGLGLAGGGLVGMTFGGIGSEGGGSHGFVPDWFVGLVYGAGVGAATGMISGTIIGHSYEYDIALDTTDHTH